MIERPEPYVHVKWLSKLMAGDISCEWAPWFKSRFKDWDKPPDDGGLVDYNINHTRMLRELKKEREALGEKVLIEGQTKFWFKRPGSALNLNGQPDLVTMDDNIVRVFDCKGGQPRTADLIQVRLYMHCLKECVVPFRDRQFEGMAVYKTHRTGVPWYSVDREFMDNFHYFLDILDSNEVPAKTPSFMECRFCDIAESVCPERISSSVSDGLANPRTIGSVSL